MVQSLKTFPKKNKDVFTKASALKTALFVLSFYLLTGFLYTAQLQKKKHAVTSIYFPHCTSSNNFFTAAEQPSLMMFDVLLHKITFNNNEFFLFFA